MEKTAEELLEEARRYLLQARMVVKEHPIEKLIKVLIFAFYVYYKGSNKLAPNQRREFKDLFDKALNFVNLDQRVKEVVPEPIVYDTGQEIEVVNALKAVPRLLDAAACKKVELEETEKVRQKEQKLSRALGMIHKSRFDGALSQFKELSEQFPNDYEIHKEISWKLFEVKHIECITFLEKTVQINPRDAESYAALGQVFRKLKKYDDSIEAHLHSLAIDPDNSTYRFNLARSYIDNRDWGKAREVLQALLERDPDLVPARQALNFVSRSLRTLD